ncbi:unnamed protein product [Allacma fusca]|uniref:Uncharacterized protein n=1 Tax=Allacma fusca TaxID=39272 RepID=A0A8J2K1G4_9HEXA|nr:unnamed protein product [Allacma fusca]
MLTRKENRFNIKIISTLAYLNFLPLTIRVDKPVAVKPGQNPSPELVVISKQTVKWKLYLWQFFRGILTCQGVYLNFRLIQSLLNKDLFHVEHFPIHYIWTACNMAGQLWIFDAFIKWPHYTFEILKQILTKIAVQVPKERRWFQLNRQELLAKYVHVMFACTAVLMTAVLVWDQSRLHMFYSAVPTRFQTPLTFSFCLIFEIISILTEISCASLNFYMHILFFEMVNNQLKAMIIATQSFKNKQLATNHVRKLRHLQILIQFFNQANSYMIFTSKLNCLAAPVITGYVAVRYFSNNPMTGIFCIVLAVDSLACFGLIYEKAFMIPANMVRLKEQVSVAIFDRRDIRSSVEQLKTLRSIPPLGIRVGSFHTMERLSTLLFIEFVTSKLASALVVF